MAIRLKTEFKFSICSSWLLLALLIFGTWLLRALKEPVTLSSWQRQSLGLTLKENAGQAECAGGRGAGTPSVSGRTSPCMLPPF